MNTTLWVLQSLIAFTFLVSGFCKSIFSEKKLVSLGQTGVEGLPLPLIRFIGITEILGAFGILLPFYLQVLPWLTTLTAICFAVIMIPAARIHYRRKEFFSVAINAVIFCICTFIAYGRTFLK